MLARPRQFKNCEKTAPGRHGGLVMPLDYTICIYWFPLRNVVKMTISVTKIVKVLRKSPLGHRLLRSEYFQTPNNQNSQGQD